ncbi:hypothetical protein LB507_009248 [Fusarium sp. FIESC RH6]|nr:hypothetical protein LB507_009248 [Fusarium sp. FIESC RH6]
MNRRSKLKSWVEGKLGIVREDSVTPRPLMLPEPRHSLTPSPSKEDVSLPKQNAPIFARLPPEIRHEILLQVFGGRTVHIHPVYNHPLDPLRPKSPSDHYSGNTERYLDRDKPKCWQWCGCVCHRNPSNVCRMFGLRESGIPTGEVWPPLYPQDPTSGLGEDMHRRWYLEEPGEDNCCKGYAIRCGDYITPKIGGTPGACLMGAMGWLLACRKAYAEGMKILYGTNTIHMGSNPLLYNLPRLILPQRLRTMDALEIVWRPDVYRLPGGRQGLHAEEWKLDQEQIPQIHDIILQTFLHVRRLHLAFNISYHVGNRPHLNNMVLRWDEFATTMARKGNLEAPLTISLTSSYWMDLYDKAKKDAVNKDSCSSTLRSQFWRWTNGKCALAPFTKSTETWGKIDGATKENGYWIVRGDKDDDRRLAAQNVCF